MDPNDDNRMVEFDENGDIIVDFDVFVDYWRDLKIPPPTEEQQNNQYWFEQCQIDDDIDYDTEGLDDDAYVDYGSVELDDL